MAECACTGLITDGGTFLTIDIQFDKGIVDTLVGNILCAGFHNNGNSDLLTTFESDALLLGCSVKDTEDNLIAANIETHTGCRVIALTEHSVLILDTLCRER